MGGELLGGRPAGATSDSLGVELGGPLADEFCGGFIFLEDAAPRARRVHVFEKSLSRVSRLSFQRLETSSSLRGTVPATCSAGS
eukprot:1347632-Pyramimonas_sp.AAC.1